MVVVILPHSHPSPNYQTLCLVNFTLSPSFSDSHVSHFGKCNIAIAIANQPLTSGSPWTNGDAPWIFLVVVVGIATWFSGPRSFIMLRLLLQASLPGKKCRTERQTAREEPHGCAIQMVIPDLMKGRRSFSTSTVQSLEVDVDDVQLQRMPDRSRRQSSVLPHCPRDRVNHQRTQIQHSLYLSSSSQLRTHSA